MTESSNIQWDFTGCQACREFDQESSRTPGLQDLSLWLPFKIPLIQPPRPNLSLRSNGSHFPSYLSTFGNSISNFSQENSSLPSVS